MRDSNRAIVAAYVSDVTHEACTWAEARGLVVDRTAVREDLCHRIARAWLTWSGTGGFLVSRAHPVGLIVGDLARLVPEVLAAWQRAQPQAFALTALEQEDAPAQPDLDALDGLDESEPTTAPHVEPAIASPAAELVSTGIELVDRALAETRRLCSQAMFDQWFGQVSFDGFEGGVLSLAVRNEFTLGWVERTYLPTLLGEVIQDAPLA